MALKSSGARYRCRLFSLALIRALYVVSAVSMTIRSMAWKISWARSDCLPFLQALIMAL